MRELNEKVEEIAARVKVIEDLPDKFEIIMSALAEFRGESSADRYSIKKMIAENTKETRRINGGLRSATERIAIVETCQLTSAKAMDSITEAVIKITDWKDNMRTVIAVTAGVFLVIGIVLGFVGKIILKV